MESTNADKREIGIENKEALENLFKLCQELEYIEGYEKNFKVGYEKFDSNQFKAPYVIQFTDKEKWIIYTTTSLRDRAKQTNWDALNIKKINKERVRKAYLVYPDSTTEREKKNFLRENKKIKEHERYSSLDGILPQDSLFNEIEKKVLALSGKTGPAKKDLEGKNFQKRIAFALSLECNFDKWKHGGMRTGLFYSFYEKILSAFLLDPAHVNKIHATADEKIIGKLPSGGNPKTDVLVTVERDSGAEVNFTISCKRSSKTDVSVAQESADTIADILDKNNVKLRRLLCEFQSAGSRSRMDENYPGDSTLLEQEMAPYVLSLCELVISGKGKPTKNKYQIADYLIFYDNRKENINVHDAHEYCLKLDKKRTRGFKTPLTWTRQGKTSSNIQFKAPTNL